MSSKESKPSSAGSNQPDWFIVEGDDRTVGTRIDQRRAARDAGGLRLRGFTEAQRHKRELISFAEMADWYRNATGRENAIEL